MLSEDLIRMANQIAHFFAVYPEADAVEGVRDHLAKFWDRAMREELLAIDAAQRAAPPTHAAPDAPGAPDQDPPPQVLEPLVVQALAALRAGTGA